MVVNENNKNEKLGVYIITASRSGYNPDKITITENTIVTLKLKSEGGKFDLFIPNLSNYVVADEEETNDISFRISETGTYRFECRDFCPSDGKIFGQLIVKPK
jgi:heme/copper-type cytochrome/quinol oxidase subunit 2